MAQLERFLEDNKQDMLTDLVGIVADMQALINGDPSEYLEYGCDEPTIDIRLCVDLDQGGIPSWIFRTGLSDYDQAHSLYCASSLIGPDTDAVELLAELTDQILEQEASI